MTNSVTVIIVNWNGGALLEECLNHLSRQILPPDRILVMDNGSTDGSAERLEHMPGITLRKLGDNLGFAAANNRGIEEADTDWIALLNPDAFPEPEWLAELLHAAQSHPQSAAFGSRQMLHSYNNTLDGIGDIYHMAGLAWRQGHGRTVNNSDLTQCEIFTPCAAAALYRREVLLEIGGLDEDFFCYMEDVDLGFRLRLAGYQCVYVPSAVVSHVGTASSGGRRSNFSTYYGHRNLVWTFIKNMPGHLFWILLPLHLILNVLSIFAIALRGQGQLMIKAKWDAVKGVPKMWRKRQAIQAQRKASPRDIWRVLDKRLSFSRT